MYDKVGTIRLHDHSKSSIHRIREALERVASHLSLQRVNTCLSGEKPRTKHTWEMNCASSASWHDRPSMLDHSWRDFRLFSNVVNCLAQENVNDKTSGKNERAIFFQILKIPKQCQIVHSFVFALTNYFLISYLPFTSGWTVPNGLYQNYKIHKTLKYNK